MDGSMSMPLNCQTPFGPSDAEIKDIVRHNQANNSGFRDLILALIARDTFRTK